MDANDTNTSNGKEDEGTGILIKKEDPSEETAVVKAEPEAASETEKISYEEVLAFLRKKGLSGTENLLKQELGNATDDKGSQKSENADSQSTSTGSAQGTNVVKTEVSGAEVSNVLSSYKSEGDPNIYAEAYKDLQRFVETSLDLYRHELALILVSRSNRVRFAAPPPPFKNPCKDKMLKNVCLFN